MMRRDAVVAYANYPDAQVVALPYQGRIRDLLVILPGMDASTTSVVSTLDDVTWEPRLASGEGEAAMFHTIPSHLGTGAFCQPSLRPAPTPPRAVLPGPPGAGCASVS